MPLSAFYRTARNTMAMWFKDGSPSAADVEAEYWKHVSQKTCHVCVHSGSIDSSTWGYGFPTTKTSATSSHPWNLKILTNNSGNVLRSLGPVMGNYILLQIYINTIILLISKQFITNVLSEG